MKKVLITGSSGQVGSRLVKKLSASGLDIYGLGSKKPFSISAEHHTYIQFDLLHQDIDTLFRDIRPDVLIHLAWETEPNSFWESPQNTVWLERSIKLVNSFGKWGGRKVVVSGTCAEYDWKADAPFVETGVEAPSSLYGQAKLDLLNFLRNQSTPFLWTRTFFQFGGKEAAGRLIPSLIDSFRTGLEFTIKRPDDIRDFIYIEDVVEIMASLVLAEEVGVFNVGTGFATTIRQLGETIASLFERHELLRFDDQNGKPSIVLADMTKLEKVLGVVDFTSLEAAISQTIRERASL